MAKDASTQGSVDGKDRVSTKAASGEPESSYISGFVINGFGGSISGAAKTFINGFVRGPISGVLNYLEEEDEGKEIDEPSTQKEPQVVSFTHYTYSQNREPILVEYAEPVPYS